MMISLPKGVRARGNNLQIRFSWNGRQQSVSLKLEPSDHNVAYAAGLVTTIKREIELGLFDWRKHFPDHPLAQPDDVLPNQNTTIAKLLDDYIREAEKTLAGVTWDNYCYRISEHLKPAFGHILLTDFTAGHVRRWIKQQSCTHTTLKSYLAPLRSALREAVLDEKLVNNPLDHFIFPKESKTQLDSDSLPDQDIFPFNREEIQNILYHCSHRPQEQNMIQFGFWTGLRLEELFAVRWKDIQLDKGTAHIRRALVKRKGYKSNGSRLANHTEMKGLKTNTKGIAAREIILLPHAIDALNNQQCFTAGGAEWVFHHPRFDTHWSGTMQFWNRWRAILTKAGVPYRNPYQIRHTWASMMLQAGEDEAWVARMLGHVDTTMVRRVYRRFIPNSGLSGGYKLRNDWQ